MGTTSSRILKIFCTIQDHNNPFPVDIEENQTVGDLKKAIKEEDPHAFADLDADDLILYHIEVPDDENMANNVTAIMQEPPPALRPTVELLDLFPETPKGRTVHILVNIPKIGKQSTRCPPWSVFACHGCSQFTLPR
jgi:hypothetical protein